MAKDLYNAYHGQSAEKQLNGKVRSSFLLQKKSLTPIKNFSEVDQIKFETKERITQETKPPDERFKREHSANSKITQAGKKVTISNLGTRTKIE